MHLSITQRVIFLNERFFVYYLIHFLLENLGQCRNNAGQAVCSCSPGYIGSPPQCRPECVVSSECTPDRACINNKCADPCPHTCGIASVCRVSNHNPICSCEFGFTGDPSTQCTRIRKPNLFSNIFFIEMKI